VSETHDPVGETPHKRSGGGRGAVGAATAQRSLARRGGPPAQLLDALTCGAAPASSTCACVTRGTGLMADIARAFNQMVTRNDAFYHRDRALERWSAARAA